jgi:hypothetical protein|tara:strand:- start:11969 stop:12142 length:174 start_codon:yes stop_codon:yes gene_type:complete
MNKVTNVNSVLETKASGALDVTEDLNKPDGKSIASLLHDQEKNDEEENNEEKEIDST